MYKLLIVEDEKMIRDGLVNQVPWNELGFETVGACSNGASALEMIKTAAPDVVLTDIKMPVMSGIELMERIKAGYPKIKIVILSGYNEFEYARKGIEYGAYSYILKPTKEKDFVEVFSRLKKDLDNLNEIPDNPEETTADSVPGVELVKKFIAENYERKITLEEVANLVYMNPSYFSSFFKSKTNQTFIEYLTQVRMNKAKELLKHRDTRVYEVAGMVGYDDFRHFSRIFKRYTG
jgi:YesN/AraC family two-component response regulator